MSLRLRSYLLVPIVFATVPFSLHARVPSAALAPPPAPTCDSGGLSPRLMIVDQGDTDPEIVAYATLEASSIWETADVQIDWVTRDEESRSPDAFIILRASSTSTTPPPAGFPDPATRTVGTVLFGEGYKRSKTIAVSVSVLAASIMDAWYAGKRLGHHAPPMQHRVVGRALGRVIAHEIGHWLVGRGHPPDGLMKASLTAQEFVRPEAPRLPRSWTATDDRRIEALRGACE